MVTRDAPHMAGTLGQAHCEKSGLDQCPPPTLPKRGQLLQLLPEVKPPGRLQIQGERRTRAQTEVKLT